MSSIPGTPPPSTIRRFTWGTGLAKTPIAWRFSAPAGAVAEAEALARWARDHAAPVEALRADSVATPLLDGLAARLAGELDAGSGVAWVRGFSDLSEPPSPLQGLSS